MTAPVNGTDERLDVVITLLRDVLAELRQANEYRGLALSAQALVDNLTQDDSSAHNAGEMTAPPAKRARKDPKK